MASESTSNSVPATSLGAGELPLVVIGLSKHFAGRPVLAHLSLELQAGQCLAFVGRNGSGKSTLLACVVGNLEADAGIVRINNFDMRNQPVEARRSLRYLAQEIDPPLGLTGRDLAAFHAEVFGAPQDLSQILELADLGPAVDALVSTYSLGMRRRLALANLCCGTPNLFVLDEPFAGLDSEARERLRGVLVAYQRQGAAFLIAGHDQDRGDLAAFGATMIDPVLLASS